jgi:hypothetical protein
MTGNTRKGQTPNKPHNPKSKFVSLGCGSPVLFNRDIDNSRCCLHPLLSMNLFAAFFYFTFAGYFAPQTRGGLSPRNV